jgi:hypothetical protein
MPASSRPLTLVFLALLRRFGDAVFAFFEAVLLEPGQRPAAVGDRSRLPARPARSSSVSIDERQRRAHFAFGFPSRRAQRLVARVDGHARPDGGLREVYRARCCPPANRRKACGQFALAARRQEFAARGRSAHRPRACRQTRTMLEASALVSFSPNSSGGSVPCALAKCRRRQSQRRTVAPRKVSHPVLGRSSPVSSLSACLNA